MTRSALVTGGSSGIGLAIARVLREEGFGLTLTARTEERLAAAAHELGALAVPADVRSEEDCERIVSAHHERFGSLDCLVNSAGVGIGSRVEDLQTKHVDLQLDVNLRGLLLVTRAALPLLKASRGSIVNLSSLAGTIPGPGLSVYAATKAAVISVTHSLNAELEADGVRATALCPGFVDTPMAAWSSIPAERMIQPQDCGEVVRALLHLSPYARIPVVVIERLGSGSSY
jgi:NAD(P)-dependent dehydrogenase (short-subunit alcohol dehydrogenase family)